MNEVAWYEANGKETTHEVGKKIKNELGIPVKLVGVGEKINDLQPFSAEEYVNALFEKSDSDNSEEYV